jgi:hypothetical protein
MTMTQQELDAQVQTLELINNEMAARLARQSDSIGKVDTKAVVVVGFVATAAQFLAAHKPQPILAGIAFAAYAVALVAGVLAFRVAEYKDLEADRLLEDNARRTKAQALMQLAATRSGIFVENRAQLNRKGTCWTVSLCAVSVGLVLSTVALGVHTGDHERSTERGSRSGTAAASAAAASAGSAAESR